MRFELVLGHKAANDCSVRPLAYLITWTTYGTWLPGDERGWHERNVSGDRPPNRFLAENAGSRLEEEPLLLTSGMRQTVEETVRRHCDVRGWTLHGVNARTNHVHVVVSAVGYKPEVVRDQFKAWCTRQLRAAAQGRKRFWTEGGSCRWINQPDELEQAVFYVLEAQDRKGLDQQT